MAFTCSVNVESDSNPGRKKHNQYDLSLETLGQIIRASSTKRLKDFVFVTEYIWTLSSLPTSCYADVFQGLGQLCFFDVVPTTHQQVETIPPHPCAAGPKILPSYTPDCSQSKCHSFWNHYITPLWVSANLKWLFCCTAKQSWCLHPPEEWCAQSALYHNYTGRR